MDSSEKNSEQQSFNDQAMDRLEMESMSQPGFSTSQSAFSFETKPPSFDSKPPPLQSAPEQTSSSDDTNMSSMPSMPTMPSLNSAMPPAQLQNPMSNNMMPPQMMMHPSMPMHPAVHMHQGQGMHPAGHPANNPSQLQMQGQHPHYPMMPGGMHPQGMHTGLPGLNLSGPMPPRPIQPVTGGPNGPNVGADDCALLVAFQETVNSSSPVPHDPAVPIPMFIKRYIKERAGKARDSQSQGSPNKNAQGSLTEFNYAQKVICTLRLPPDVLKTLCEAKLHVTMLTDDLTMYPARPGPQCIYDNRLAMEFSFIQSAGFEFTGSEWWNGYCRSGEQKSISCFLRPPCDSLTFSATIEKPESLFNSRRAETWKSIELRVELKIQDELKCAWNTHVRLHRRVGEPRRREVPSNQPYP